MDLAQRGGPWLLLFILGILTYRARELRWFNRGADGRLLVETDSPYLAPVPHRGNPTTGVCHETLGAFGGV